MRSAVKEQIESLGARFLELDMGLEDAEAAGGYARQLTDEEQQKQRELLAVEIGKMDAVISTAAVPGRRAPLLVTEQAVKNMKPGSVIVDLAGGDRRQLRADRAGADRRQGGRDDRRRRSTWPRRCPTTPRRSTRATSSRCSS